MFVFVFLEFIVVIGLVKVFSKWNKWINRVLMKLMIFFILKEESSRVECENYFK